MCFLCFFVKLLIAGWSCWCLQGDVTISPPICPQLVGRSEHTWGLKISQYSADCSGIRTRDLQGLFSEDQCFNQQNFWIFCFRNCEYFNLCSGCEARPREEIGHDVTHLFIKLKTPVVRPFGQHQPPREAVLSRVCIMLIASAEIVVWDCNRMTLCCSRFCYDFGFAFQNAIYIFFVVHLIQALMWQVSYPTFDIPSIVSFSIRMPLRLL